MIYQDRIYGKVDISLPLVLELIESPSLQRLKGIDQRGYFEPFFPGTGFSRFEHSLGVFVLLKKYGAPFEEQVAGLIHDVSHSVFSHCIDYALEEGSEKEHNHQDNIFESFVKNTEIPSILKTHELGASYILNEKNFPLKEKLLPDLCADRIDYSFRTGLLYKEISQEDIDYFLENLTVENNFWVFKDFENAKRYADLFEKLNSLYYAGLPSGIMFRTVGDCLKYALQKDYITKEDLYTTDREVLEKIEKHLKGDEKLSLLFERMNNKIKVENNPEDFNAHVFCKSRIVDPLCKYGRETKRVSDIDKNWIKMVKKESVPKEYFIKFAK